MHHALGTEEQFRKRQGHLPNGHNHSFSGPPQTAHQPARFKATAPIRGHTVTEVRGMCVPTSSPDVESPRPAIASVSLTSEGTDLESAEEEYPGRIEHHEPQTTDSTGVSEAEICRLFR